MPTIQLIPSAWTNSGSYSFTNQTLSNAYTNTDSSTSNRMTLSASRNSARTSAGYYTLTSSDLGNVPSDAIINSVELKVKYYVNNTTYCTDVTMQFQSGSTSKGSSITERPTSANTYTASSSGSWTVAELQNARLSVQATHNTSTSSAYLYFYGAEINVDYSLPVYHNVTSSSSVSGVSITPSSQSVLEGSNIDLTIVSDGSNFLVKDNNVDVTNSLVPLSPTGSNTCIPNNYTNLSSGVTINSSNPITNTYRTASTSGSYARLDFSASTTGYIELLFDIPSLPSGATLTSISARAGLKVSSTSRLTNTICRLYNGSSAKGNNITFSSTTATVYNLDCGSWTDSELSNLRMRIGATSSSSSQSKYISIYGADITINYELSGEYYTYTINNVIGDHNVEVVAPNYNVTSSKSGSGSISPSGTSTLNPGDSYTLTMTPSDFDNIVVTLLDNGNDVSSQIVESGNEYTYTINNIQENHNLVATFNNSYNITTSLDGEGTISQSQKVIQGANYELTITPNFPDGAIVTLTDNGNDVTSSLVNHTTYYTYTINNVNSSHTLQVVIVSPLVISFELHGVSSGRVKVVTASGTTTISDGSYIAVQTGESKTIRLSMTSSVVCQVVDNNVDITSTGVYNDNYSSIEYNIKKIVSNHYIVITENQATQKTVTFINRGNYGYFTDTSSNPIQTVTVNEGSIVNFYIQGLYQNVDTSVVPNGIDGLVSLVLNNTTDIINEYTASINYDRFVNYKVLIFEDSVITMDTDIIYDWVEVDYSNTSWPRVGSHNIVYYSSPCCGLIGYHTNGNRIFRSDGMFYIYATYYESQYDPDPQYPQYIYPYKDQMASFKYTQQRATYPTYTTYNDHAVQLNNPLRTTCYFDLKNFDFINAADPNYLRIAVDNAGNPKKFRVDTEIISGNGTISAGNTNITQLDTYTLTVTPDNPTDIVTITDQYYDITDQLTKDSVSNSYSYTATRINRDHYYRATISESLGYEINNSIVGKGTISNNSIVEEGDPATITITPTYPSQSTVTATDNGNNITSLLVRSGNDYLYTINSVNEDHTIVGVISLPTYNITNSVVGDGTISSNIVAEYGDNKTITITPTNISFASVSLIDNNVDVSSSLVNTGSAYTYQLSNITTNHTIVATITTVSSYQISTSISGSGTITPSTQVAEGSNFQVTITPYNMEVMIVLLDNNIDMSNYVINTGSAYTYTIQNVQEAHTISATITNLPTIDDWHVKIQTPQTRDINVNETWVSVDTPYYKVNDNDWITPEKVYYKYGGNWILVWPKNTQGKLIFEANLTSDLSYHNYLDGTTGNMSWYSGSPTYSNNMLQITTNSDNNFRVYIPLTSSANPQLRAFLMDSTKEHWFTVKTYIDSWGSTNYQWAFECGFSTNANSYTRDDSIFYIHQVNGPYYRDRSDQGGAPYAPAGATVWQKTNLTPDGYLMHYFNATPSWTTNNGNSNTNPGTWYQASRKTNEIYDTSRATWNHSNITGMGWGSSNGSNSVVRMSTLKIWNDEPTDAEIGIE